MLTPQVGPLSILLLLCTRPEYRAHGHCSRVLLDIRHYIQRSLGGEVRRDPLYKRGLELRASFVLESTGALFRDLELRASFVYSSAEYVREILGSVVTFESWSSHPIVICLLMILVFYRTRVLGLHPLPPPGRSRRAPHRYPARPHMTPTLLSLTSAPMGQQTRACSLHPRLLRRFFTLTSMLLHRRRPPLQASCLRCGWPRWSRRFCPACTSNVGP